MNRLAGYAFRKMFAGIRLGQPAVASLGAAVSLIGWLRRRSAAHRREKIYAKTLKPGQAVRVRMIQDDTVIREEVIEG